MVLAGEVKSKTYLDLQEIARGVIRKIGYTRSEYMFETNGCGIISAIHEQSADINQGVDRHTKEEQGAGDQGMMFGYATRRPTIIYRLRLIFATQDLIWTGSIASENKKSNTWGQMQKARLHLSMTITTNQSALTRLLYQLSTTISIPKKRCRRR